jgi:hypothetical protein
MKTSNAKFHSRIVPNPNFQFFTVEGARVQVNFGGWGNSIHAVQVNSSEPVASIRGTSKTTVGMT